MIENFAPDLNNFSVFFQLSCFNSTLYGNASVDPYMIGIPALLKATKTSSLCMSRQWLAIANGSTFLILHRITTGYRVAES